MSGGWKELRARRAALLARAAAQRDELEEQLAVLRGPLEWVDRGLSLLAARRRAPRLGVGLGLGLATLVVFRSRGAAALVTGGFAAYRLARSIGALLTRLRA